MRGLISFLTRGTKLSGVPSWKIALMMVGTIAVVFVSGIERRSSRLVEWLLDPDNLINFAVDWRGDAPNGTAVTVVDIDDGSYEAWGQPLATPRSKLFDLVDVAASRDAAAIVVDIDVIANATLEEAKVTLERLSAFSARQVRGYRKIPLVLVRSLWSDGKAVHMLSRQPEFDSARIREVNALVDDLASGRTEQQSAIIWASALFDADTGGVIREWRLIEVVCDDGRRQPIAFPSVGVVIASLGGRYQQTLDAIRGASSSYAREYCEARSQKRVPPTSLVGFDWLVNHPTKERLPYLFWPARLEPFRFGTARESSGRRVPLLDIRLASAILDKEQAAKAFYSDPSFCDRITDLDPVPISCDALRGRVVVIGASHRDSRDTHFTPLGPMPGVYVVANTMAGARDTLSSKRHILGSSFWGVCLFLVFAGLAARLRSIFAVAFGAVIALAFLSFFSDWAAIPVSQAYESVNISIIMLAIFLTASSIAPDVERWLFEPLVRAARRMIPGKWKQQPKLDQIE